jgi:hypothetical protein
MNHSAEICRAMLNDSKLKLFSSVCDRVGISENVGNTLINKLCAEGTLRRERDYVLIKDEAKAKRLAEGVQPPTKAETRVAEGMTANKKAPAPPVAAATKRDRQSPVDVPVPESIKIEKCIPIPAKRWGKVAAVCPWPFLEMEVGDSFAVPVPDDMKPTQVAGTLRKAATIRTEVGDKTVRLWRDPDAESKAVPVASPAARSSNGIRTHRVKQPA